MMRRLDPWRLLLAAFAMTNPRVGAELSEPHHPHRRALRAGRRRQRAGADRRPQAVGDHQAAGGDRQPPGAGGNVGADAVAKSAPDGYTILLHTSAHASAGPLYKSLPFDPIKDFAPVTMVIATQTIICGSLKNPATTLRELIAQAKAKPGSLNYASSGPGSSLHLFAELLKISAGVDIVHIPYRGDAPMITALIAGDVQLAFLPQSTGLAAMRASRSGRSRSPAASG